MGTRVTFSRVKDEERTFEKGVYHYEKKNGKGSAKTADRAAVIEMGKRPGKKGTPNEANRYLLDKLLVADVLAGPTPVKGAKATKATAAKAAAPVAVDADAVLKAVLAAGPVDRAKLDNAVLRYTVTAKVANDARAALRKQIADDAYLADAQERGIVIVDSDAAGSPVMLAA
jgi:hypothetical protein